MKKTFVLIVLFILPIVAYLFFASGVHSFGMLPKLTENLEDLQQYNSEVSLENKITILGFFGQDVASKKGIAFNVNQKIYKRFAAFKDFQFVMLVSDTQKEEIAEFKKELGALSAIDKWRFVYMPNESIKAYFESLKTNLTLGDDYGSSYMFIVDKDRTLRGRKADEDEGLKYGYNALSVAEINNKMEDDVKIILAEYRMALKKNNAYRSK